MMRVALSMLFRDTGKYFGIIMGVALAAMVITQQGSIFIGLMSRTYAAMSDMPQARIWVMDPKVQFIDDTKPLQDTELYRVRSVRGVAWAVPFYKGMVRVRLSNGLFQNCNLFGLDDSTLIGAPARMLDGSAASLRQADSVLVDKIGAEGRLATPSADPKGKPAPLRVGNTLEINDHRAIVVGLADATRSFQSQPNIYTTYSRATTFAPRERKMLSFVFASAAEGESERAVCERITRETGLAAYTHEQFRWLTVMYFVKNTGIPINFGISVALGLVIGAVITGFMFYSFTVDNLRYFGTLKAMGASDTRLLGMIVVQALVVGLIGWGLGVGIAAMFGRAAQGGVLAFRTVWQLLLMSGGAVTAICVLAAMLSIHKVVKLEPAVVFKG